MPSFSATSPMRSLIDAEMSLGMSSRRLVRGLELLRFSSRRVSPIAEVLS